MANVIGIDLGTTYSAISTIDETGRPKILHNAEGKNITPSCILLTENNSLEVGEEARRMLGIDNNTCGRFKRDMGKNIKLKLGDKQYSPADLSAVVLKKLKQDAEKSIGEISEAVVTIPANFNNEAREATMEATRIAGLNVQYIVNEPTAAALYYAFEGGHELGGIYAVYDLGGGTFDISIIQVNGQDVDVIATNGVQVLGGDDFDEIIIKMVEEKYIKITGEKLDIGDFTKSDAEEEKKSLSKREKVAVRINRQIIELTKNDFEKNISSLITQAELLCESTLDEAKISVSDIKGVFLVGGSTRVPAVLKSVKDIFKQEPISSINVDEVVSLGAALYAAYKGDKSNLNTVQKKAIEQISVSESTSKCFGTEAVVRNEARNQNEMMNSIIIRKGEKIPCEKTNSYFTIHEGQTGIDIKITESVAPEEDMNFVKIIWEGELELPPNRPAGQELLFTYKYDDNQIMKCKFIDKESGKEKKVELSMTNNNSDTASEIEEFVIE